MNFETRIEEKQCKIIGRDMAELHKEAKRLIESDGYAEGFAQGTDASGLYMVTLSKRSKLDPKPEPKAGPIVKEAKK